MRKRWGLPCAVMPLILLGTGCSYRALTSRIPWTGGRPVTVEEAEEGRVASNQDASVFRTAAYRRQASEDSKSLIKTAGAILDQAQESP